MSQQMLGTQRVHDILADPAENAALEVFRNVINTKFVGAGFQTIDIPQPNNADLARIFAEVFGNKFIFLGMAGGKRIMLGSTTMTYNQTSIQGVVRQRFNDFLSIFNAIPTLPGFNDVQVLMVGDYASFKGNAAGEGNIMTQQQAVARTSGYFYTIANANNIFLTAVGGVLEKISSYKVHIINARELDDIVNTTVSFVGKRGVALATENKKPGQ